MGNGFLDDMPDLGMGGARPKRKKRPAPKVTHEGPVLWQPVKCPECGGSNCPVHTTRKPIRYHKCTDCGCLFKSIERG